MNLITSASANGLLTGYTLSEATIMLIEYDPRLQEIPVVVEFLYRGRHLDVAPYEALGTYFKAPTTTDDKRQEIIQGCLLYLGKVEKRIKSGGRISFDSFEPEYIYGYPLQAFSLLAASLASNRPDLIGSLLSKTSELADYCLATNYASASVTRNLFEITSTLDKRDWDVREPYWLELLSKTYARGYAFNHILMKDPTHPSLDQAIIDILHAQLRREDIVDGVMLLADLHELRNNDDTLLYRTLNAVSEELQPELVMALKRHSFSASWVQYLPERSEASLKQLTSTEPPV